MFSYLIFESFSFQNLHFKLHTNKPWRKVCRSEHFKMLNHTFIYIFGLLVGNSVIFINREILPGPDDASICYTFFLTTPMNLKKYSIDNDFLWNTAVYFYLFIFWELKSTKTEIEALSLFIAHHIPKRDSRF